MNIPGSWDLELECKPQLEKNLERIYAWYEQEVVDRPPVRFVSNNQVFRDSKGDDNVGPGKRWEDYNARWYDAEYRVLEFEKSIECIELLGENMPIFWPDYSPNFLAGAYGAPIKYDQTTGWVERPILKGYDDLEKDLVFQTDGALYRNAEELVTLAASRCKGKYLVGFPDHNILGDCLEALRGTTEYLMDLYDDPDAVHQAHDKITADFLKSYDHFDSIVKKAGSMSCNWMGIPSFGKFYVPTADISSMFSTDMYEEFYFDTMDAVINRMDHTVYHTDGKDVAKHIDVMLQHKKLNGFQWVQGMGNDRPILQWVPLIQKIQAAGKSVICDVDLKDLEQFITEVPDPKGIFLFVESHDPKEQKQIIKRLEKW